MGVFIRQIRQIGKGMETPPTTIIDPYLFKLYQVDSVPAIAIGGGEGRQKVVVGLLSFDWLEQRPLGRQPVQGQTYAIAEPDMVEEMQRRLANFDWNGWKEKAIQNYWKQHGDFLDLPETQKETVRHIDPSIRVTKDIALPNGTVLAKAGDMITPNRFTP